MIKDIDFILDGAMHVKLSKFSDLRGDFIKTFHTDILKKNGIEFKSKEEFYSISKKHVIRGMHFQIPPFEHEKIVMCLNGTVRDVIIDIRKNSKTFGEYQSFELDVDKPSLLYIPVGFAHGFMSRTDNSLLYYKTTSVYNKDSDSGIRWDSFGFDWGCKNPIISERDQNFIKLGNFETYF